MRRSVFHILLFLACLLCQNAEAKVKQKPVYVFGYAISFADSTGYITDVQYLDSAYVDTKTKFLMGRNMYSLQLQQYLQKNEGCKHPVTSVFFGTRKEKVEKKRQSVRHRYEKYRDYTVKNVDCVFTSEAYYGQDATGTAVSGKSGKKESQKSKRQ